MLLGLPQSPVMGICIGAFKLYSFIFIFICMFRVVEQSLSFVFLEYNVLSHVIVVFCNALTISCLLYKRHTSSFPLLYVVSSSSASDSCDSLLKFLNLFVAGMRELGRIVFEP